MLEGRFAVITACMVASGATALAYLTVLAGLFPNAPNDAARLHLLIGSVLPFFGFMIAVFMAVSAVLFEKAGSNDVWVATPQVIGALINLLILFILVNQTAAALGQWFEGEPGSSESVDWLIQGGLLIGVGFVVASLVTFAVRFVIQRRGKSG